MNEPRVPQTPPVPPFPQHWILRELFDITGVPPDELDQGEDDDEVKPETEAEPC